MRAAQPRTFSAETLDGSRRTRQSQAEPWIRQSRDHPKKRSLTVCP